MRIVPYSPEHAEEWNAFVVRSKNGTFLLDRGYMDYHAERFADASLLCTEDDGRWLAVLPGNRVGDTVETHGGLTYGGWLTDERMSTPRMLEVFSNARTYLVERGVRKVIYKTIPHIYHRMPAEEDRYALFREGASLVRRDVLTVVDPRSDVRYQERRARGVKRALKSHLKVTLSQDWPAYWEVLSQVLEERHGVRPVHTVDEITLLRNRFPQNVHLYVGALEGRIAGGVVVFESSRVAHVQYIAASPLGREKGCLDAVFDHLIRVVYRDKPVVDFGISNEDAGRTLNVGLIEQKEGFGARAVVHDFYEWPLEPH